MTGLMVDCFGREVHRGDLVVISSNYGHTIGVVERSEPSKLHYWRLDQYGYNSLHWRRNKSQAPNTSYSYHGSVDYIASRHAARTLLINKDNLTDDKRAIYDYMMKVF